MILLSYVEPSKKIQISNGILTSKVLFLHSFRVHKDCTFLKTSKSFGSDLIMCFKSVAGLRQKREKDNVLGHPEHGFTQNHTEGGDIE